MIEKLMIGARSLPRKSAVIAEKVNELIDAGGSGTPDNTTDKSIPLKNRGSFVDSPLKSYIPQGGTEPILDSSAPLFLGSVDDTKDTPIFIYRGNGQPPPNDFWGGAAFGVYQGGDYAIFDYFNKNGKSYALHVGENGLNVRKNGGDIIPLSDALISTEIGEFRTSTTQNPTGLGDTGKIKVNFGIGGDTQSHEFSVSSGGVVTCNTDNIQYDIDLTLRIGRTGAAGVSILLGRLMYADDGIEANAVQVNSTSVTEIDDQDTIWREEFKFRLEPSSGAIFWIEIARDEAGNNSGGILTVQPTATLASWNPSDSARITFNKLLIK